jgi:hypothetical protein
VIGSKNHLIAQAGGKEIDYHHAEADEYEAKYYR